MHLTLRQLQVFAAVAEHASFSKAAAELHLTQPAVSIQVKHLEESIGLPLFERIGKKLFLTEAGSELRSYSQSIAQQLDDAREVFAQLKDASRGHLRVAVAPPPIPSPAICWLPSAVSIRMPCSASTSPTAPA